MKIISPDTTHLESNMTVISPDTTEIKHEMKPIGSSKEDANKEQKLEELCKEMKEVPNKESGLSLEDKPEVTKGKK